MSRSSESRHRLKEIFNLCDRVTVLRDGDLVTTLDTAATPEAELVRLMVGRAVANDHPVSTAASDAVLFQARGMRAGEILGLAGLVGTGRTETARLIFGADPRLAGEILVAGQVVSISSPCATIVAGICVIPMIASARRAAEPVHHLQHGLCGAVPRLARLAKWLLTESRALIFDQPTRGIDLGPKREIYALTRRMSDRGAAIIMISSEMPELLGMSNRILVIAQGRIAGELAHLKFDQERVLRLASGL